MTGSSGRILPSYAGLILADDHDAEILRMPDPTPLAAARRRALTRRVARTAAERLARLLDPLPGLGPDPYAPA